MGAVPVREPAGTFVAAPTFVLAEGAPPFGLPPPQLRTSGNATKKAAVSDCLRNGIFLS